jgi:hypothetical protein
VSNKCDTCSEQGTQVLFFAPSLPPDGNYATHVKPLWLCEKHYRAQLKSMRTMANSKRSNTSFHYQRLLQLNEEHLI